MENVKGSTQFEFGYYDNCVVHFVHLQPRNLRNQSESPKLQNTIYRMYDILERNTIVIDCKCVSV